MRLSETEKAQDISHPPLFLRSSMLVIDYSLVACFVIVDSVLLYVDVVNLWITLDGRASDFRSWRVWKKYNSKANEVSYTKQRNVHCSLWCEV